MSLFECKNLSLGYDSKVIVSGLDFKINDGDYLCIVGENGSGKSTLMRTMLGLIPPLGGEIITRRDFSQKEIGYLPQQTNIQRDFPASVWEIVLSGNQARIGNRPFYNKTEKQRAEEAIEKMGICDIKNSCYRELSGGQQQRVLLARALCATEKMLLLDEPVSGLDPKVTTEMYNLIYTLNKRDNITVVMISHDISAAVKYATQILHIGTNLFYGTKEEYMFSDLGKLFKG